MAAAPADPPGTSLGGAAERLVLSSRASPRSAPLDDLLHDPSVPVVARGGEGVRRQWRSLGGLPFAVLRSAASAAALGRPLKLDAGISLKFPSAEAERGYEHRWCCGWQLLFLADFQPLGRSCRPRSRSPPRCPAEAARGGGHGISGASLVARSRTTRLRTAPPSSPASGGSSAGSCVQWSTSSARVRRPGSADRSVSRMTH